MYRTYAYIWRDLIRWSRSPLNIVSTLAMPATWLIFVGCVMPVKYDNYLNFVTPGVLVLTMMTSGLSAGTSLMFDKTLGYLNKFLSLPAPRESILLGKIIFVTVRGLIQCTVILVIAILIGATVLPLTAYIGMYAVLFIFGLVMSSIGATAVLYMKDHDTYAAFLGLVSMPLYFASTALISYENMPLALQYISSCNPMSYAIDAMRDLSAGSFPTVQITILCTLAIAMILICSRRFNNVTMH